MGRRLSDWPWWRGVIADPRKEIYAISYIDFYFKDSKWSLIEDWIADTMIVDRPGNKNSAVLFFAWTSWSILILKHICVRWPMCWGQNNWDWFVDTDRTDLTLPLFCLQKLHNGVVQDSACRSGDLKLIIGACCFICLPVVVLLLLPWFLRSFTLGCISVARFQCTTIIWFSLT